MRTYRRWLLLALPLLAVTGCTSAQPSRPSPATAAPTTPPPHPPPTQIQLIVTSPAFKDGQPIPTKYTADGQGISPPLEWTVQEPVLKLGYLKDNPLEVKEFVLIVSDPDAPRGTYYHWTLYGMAPTVTSLSEDLPKTDTLTNPKASQGLNSGGTVGYTPPSPPPGKVHHYHFRLYALRQPSGLAPRATPEAVEAAVVGPVLAQGELVGTYQR